MASSTSEFSQTISEGTLTTDIRDSGRNPVASPSVTMSGVTVSFSCQESTGTFGTNSERIYVDNPGAADDGWTLTVAASSTTALWSNSAGTLKFDFNDPNGSGCTDGGDSDSYGGQMTIDPSAGSINTDCSSCNSTGITLGTSASFSEGATDSITLVTAANSSSDVGRWYFTGFSISQDIPAEQDADTYTIDLSLTVTAS